MVQPLEIILVVWILSLWGGLFFITMWKLMKKAWAEEIFIICLIFFFGIPMMLIIAYIFGLTDVFTEFLKNLVA